MREAIEGGFAEPVFAAQRLFRGVMDALARPGSIHPFAAVARPPAAMPPLLGALVLTLADQDSPLWLDSLLASSSDVAAWVRFHTGAPIVSDLAGAMFALIAEPTAMPLLADFAMGTDEYPDRSTTLMLAVESLEGGPMLQLQGPGIEYEARLAPRSLPVDFIAQWEANRRKFPRGVDVLLVAPDAIAALPRTTLISEA